MKFQIFIILGFAAAATVAVPNARARRQDSSGTASPCSRSSGSVGDLLARLGNLLDIIIENRADIDKKTMSENDRELNQFFYERLISEIIGARNFFEEVRYSGSILNDFENCLSLEDLTEYISNLLDALLGDGTSASSSSAGVISGLLQTLTDDNIITNLTTIIEILNPTIQSMIRVSSAF